MRLVTRAQWGARARRYINRANMDGPVVIHWNGPTVTVNGARSWDHSKCASLIRGIQNYHMDAKGWSDIAYNFMVCPHGYVFEGRGYDVVNGANGTNESNHNSHAVMCLAGRDNSFGDKEKVAVNDIISSIQERTSTKRVFGHRDVHSTECPGDRRYGWIKAGRPEYIAPSVTGTTSRPTLRLGSSGDFVRLIQTIMRDRANQNITVDGSFGPATEKAVKNIQTVGGITADGIVGEATWKIFDKLLAT